MLNDLTGRAIIMYNNEELTQDTIEDIQQYYIDYGLDPERLEDSRIKFVEKEYAFFRGWMDNGISDSTILKVVRAMVMQRKNDSRMIDLASILPENELVYVEDLADSIWLPEWADINMLRNLSPFYMMGGGRNECLREIELVCNAFNIRYKRIDKLVY